MKFYAQKHEANLKNSTDYMNILKPRVKINAVAVLYSPAAGGLGVSPAGAGWYFSYSVLLMSVK